MNCFNIREIQSILKKRFFVDLINTHDHHNLLNKTAMGLRFKTNNINSLNSNTFVFYNYGIEFTPKTRLNNYNLKQEISSNDVNSFKVDSIFFKYTEQVSPNIIFSFFNRVHYFLFASNVNFIELEKGVLNFF
jgi:hypothetical protein